MQEHIVDMTLEEQIGQMFITRVGDPSETREIVSLLDQFHIGGIYLDSEQVDKKKKFLKANRNLQYYASNQRPLFILHHMKLEQIDRAEAIDYMPSESLLASVDNRLYSRQMAEVVGQAYRELGLNAFLYPNLQVEQDGELREVLAQTSQHGLATIQGFRKSGIISFLHGFPPLNEIDPYIEPNRKNSILYPFYQAIQADADVLVIDGLAEEGLHSIVRRALHFDGILALQLPNEEQSIEEMAEHICRAFALTVDLIILPKGFSDQVSLFHRIYDLVQEGRVERTSIEESANKILSLKHAYKLNEVENPFTHVTPYQAKRIKENFFKRLQGNI